MIHRKRMASMVFKGKRTQHVFLELEPESWIEIKNDGSETDEAIHAFLEAEKTGTKHLRFGGGVFGGLIQDWAEMEPAIPCEA